MQHVINPHSLEPTLDNTFEYEVYTKNPETGETGWEINFVTVVTSKRSEALELLKTFPN